MQMKPKIPYDELWETTRQKLKLSFIYGMTCGFGAAVILINICVLLFR